MSPEFSDILDKIENAENDVLVWAVRTRNNVDYGVRALRSIRRAELGDDTNKLLDRLLEIGWKLQTILGSK